MPFKSRTLPKLFLVASVFFVLVRTPLALTASSPEPLSKYPAALTAEFRGCEAAGWCRFRIDSVEPLASSAYRVYPDGVARSPENNEVSKAIRNRMNALLSNMVHQHKRIELHDLREFEDGMFVATVTVNESNLALDPVLLELYGEFLDTTR